MPSKAAGRRLAMPLLRFVQDLLALGQTLKAASLMAGLGRNVVKAAGIACDMNADFERAFPERHPHPAVIYDRFHLVRSFNDKAISEARKDGQRRLRDEGGEEGARGLKSSKHILMSSPSTRRAKDRAARAGKAVTKGSGLSGRTETPARGGSCQRCRDLLERNGLLATCGIVKDMLAKAYACRQPKRMRSMMGGIAETCRSTGNRHFAWFARLVEGHMEGIVAHARHQASSGRAEGTNGMIKTLRRCGYGYPDDEHFFLKIFNASRRCSA